MSAFVVFSMMGFFPVCPGVGVYATGCPFFDEVCIQLADGKEFTIKAKGSSSQNHYIQGAKLNGKVLNRSWFTHEELMAGGVLEFEMGPEPDYEWGSVNLPVTSLDYGK